MRSGRSRANVPRFTCIEEIPRTSDWAFMDYPASLTCDFCKGKNQIVKKKGKVQNPIFILMVKSSRCEQRWVDEHENKPNIIKAQSRFKMKVVN